MSRYTSLASIENTKWLESKITKLMDPNMTASNFREFLKQIGKYLSKQEKLKQMEDHALIKKKLDFLHEYKEFIQENEGQSLQKFPTIVDHLDNGYNSNFIF
jgi:hypothetical protein